jgi:GTP-binding protein YchF
LRLAITGLSNSGKTTVFNALTGQHQKTTIYPTAGGDPVVGVVKVPDPRVDILSGIFRPRKTTHATVEYIDYIGLTKGDVSQNRKVFDLIKDADAIVHVVRAFQDDSVPHPFGEVGFMRDIGAVELELIFGDLEFVEKRLTRIEDASRKGKKPGEGERRLLLKCREALEREMPLRDVSFTEEERQAMRSLQFVSTKPEVVVLNIGEDMLQDGRAANIQGEAERYFSEKKGYGRALVATLCGKIEMDIAQLTPEDAKAFLDDLGIGEPALDRLIHLSFELLGLISFLTVVKDEVRAWTVTRGTDALRAAGKIHSDMERGFIKAEVINYESFISVGSLSAAREQGLLRLEGKTYEVKDGDIIHFRFNV